MLYLLDANVLIDAHRDYYPLERVPEFWAWLEFQGIEDRVKIPLEVYEEVREGTDSLADWVKSDSVKAQLLLPTEVEPKLVDRVVSDGYASDLTDDELLKLGRDPFLIAYALVDPPNRCVVTTEVSRPSRQRANRHIPDVCRTLNVRCCNTFDLTRALDFSTRWRVGPNPRHEP